MKYVNEIRGEGRYKCIDKKERPHIFLISVDMMPPDVYGDGDYAKDVNTPNLDKLKKDGVYFKNAFCNSPLCGPSRETYMTGRYSYITVNEERAHDGQAFELRYEDIIYPEYLRSVGYYTRHIGKCHVGYKKFIDAFGENDTPWNRWAPPVTDDDSYLNYLKELGVKQPKFSRSIQGLQQDRKTPGNFYGGWIVQQNGKPFPVEGTYPYYLARKAEKTLEAALNKREQPIYLQLDFFAPHQPFMIPSGLKERESYLRKKVNLPSSYQQLLNRDFKRFEGEPKIYDTYRKNWGLYKQDTLRDYITANLLQVEVLDKALGLFLKALENKGLYRNSVVVFLGDHGEMNGEKGLIDKGVYGHPKILRVPLILKLPLSQYSTNEVNTPVSLLDIAPTLLKLAGVKPYARLDGENLMPFIKADKKTRDKNFLFEAGWHVAPNPAVSLQSNIDNKNFLYTYNLTSDYDELYDLEDKSYKNLAQEPDYEEVKAKMISHLARFLKNDRRWRCYWHTFRIHKYHYLEIKAGDQQMFTPE